MEKIIEIEKLGAGYNDIEIVKDVSFSVGKREIVSLIGPNGAGKSTLLKSVFGLTDIIHGKILFNGNSVFRRKPDELISAGVCFINQGRTVFGNLRVRENLEIGSAASRGRDEFAKRLKNIYEKFPILLERAEDFAYTLSGGQRQILAIARVLLHSPKLILMDEPSLGLSPKLREEIFLLITNLKKEGISILLVEQNAKRAIEIADRTILLEGGRIVLEGSRDFIGEHKKIKEVYFGERH